jgi:MFS family permease
MVAPQAQKGEGSPRPAAVPEVASPGLAGSFRALRHRNFRLFIGGQAVSLVGTWMQNVAQSWLVYRLTHSEMLLGTTWFCSQIAVFALAPLGGLAADRFSRQKLVIVTQTLSMLQAFILAALTLTHHVQVWHILVLGGVLGMINAFDMPGRQALVIHMASQEDLLPAISLNSAVFNTARVVGPGMAGLVVAAVGEGVCFFLNGVSFLAVIFSLAAMRIPALKRPKPEPPLQRLIDGFRYTWQNHSVRRVLGLMAAATLAGMPVLVLTPFFADGIFHQGSRGLGFLMAAMGVGAVAGTLGLARNTRLSALPRVMAYSGILVGCGYLAFGLSPRYWFSLMVMPLLGCFMMRQMVSANTAIQTLIPDDYRGRVMSLYSMTVVGLGPFGSLAAGAIAARLGARAAVVVGAVLAAGAAAVFGWSRKRREIAG